jgi:hypothetical protein
MKFSFDPIHEYKTFVCLLDDTPFDDYWRYNKYDLVVRMNRISPKYSTFTVLKSEFRKQFPMINPADQTKFMLVCTEFIKENKHRRSEKDEWIKDSKIKYSNKYSYDPYSSYKKSHIIKTSKKHKSF